MCVYIYTHALHYIHVFEKSTRMWIFHSPSLNLAMEHPNEHRPQQIFQFDHCGVTAAFVGFSLVQVGSSYKVGPHQTHLSDFLLGPIWISEVQTTLDYWSDLAATFGHLGASRSGALGRFCAAFLRRLRMSFEMEGPVLQRLRPKLLLQMEPHRDGLEVDLREGFCWRCWSGRPAGRWQLTWCFAVFFL